MHLDLKVAIVRSGKPQYRFAQDIGVSESRLSKYLRGYGSLRSEQIEKLAALLGLRKECVGEQGR
jgi:transcriptional regulator with XRE-family HTH domain